MTTRPCPYLGRVGDATTFHLEPHAAHRCQATDPPGPIDLEHQRAHCYADHLGCEHFVPLAADGRRGPPTPRAPSLDAEAASAPESKDPPSDAARRDDSGWATSLSRWARGLSFEEWLVYGGAAVLLAAIAWTLTLGGQSQPPLGSGDSAVDARAAELQSTITPTPTSGPSPTPRPTRDSPQAATIVAPTPPAGGLMAALTPAERAVGSFNDRDRVPQTGDRAMYVGGYEDLRYAGGMMFLLNRIPANSRLTYAALEIAGLEDADLLPSGSWTVEILDSAAADDWSNLTYPTLLGAATAGLPAWELPSSELGAGKINVLELDEAALDHLRGRMDQGRLAFRVVGPELEGDSLFAWDTGYGEGFGTRPVLRVGFIPPPATAGPARGEPTAVPLLVPVVEPTAAPAATDLPADLPQALKGRILFVSSRGGAQGLYLMDPDSRELWRVTQSWPYQVARRRDSASSGVQVTNASRPCGGQRELNDRGEAVLVDPADPARQCAQLIVSTADGPPTEITEPGALHYDPAISPDGQWIAYVSNVTGNDEIFKIRVNGSENTRLTENVWEWDKHPSWSPDSSRIVFWSNREGRSQLYIMNADGTGVTNLSANAFEDSDPVWVR